MIRVIGVGDCFVDRYLFQNTMYPGGNSVSFAVFARVLGHESAFCGNLAQDVYAGMILDALDAWHIEHEHCRILPDGETGHGSIQLVNGDRVISDDNGSAKRDPLPITPELLQYLRGFDLIHSACYGFLEPQLPRLSCAGVPIAFDCSENRVDEGYLNAVAPYCSIILFSGSAYPRQLLLRRMRQARVLGCDIAIGTVGAQGALVWAGQQLYELAPYRAVGGILDTTGAGDSFFTGFCTTYIEGRKPLMALLDQGAFDLCAQDHASFRAALSQRSMHTGNAMAMRTCMTPGSFGRGVSIDLEEKTDAIPLCCVRSGRNAFERQKRTDPQNPRSTCAAATMTASLPQSRKSGSVHRKKKPDAQTAQTPPHRSLTEQKPADILYK